MPGHEKLFKKVEQDRAKGQFDRALARLKEAVAENPRDFQLAQEAARLCFELGRTLEGANILRAAMKRRPSDRGFALEMLEREFASSKHVEVGEILYEALLAQNEIDRARDVITALPEPERGKLLVKLQTKIASVTAEAPQDFGRLTSLRLAEALVLSSLRRSAEFAATLEKVLDLEPSQVQNIGRLAKLEVRESPQSGPVHLLLARCYGSVAKPEMAAEHAVAGGHDAACVDRAIALLDAASESPVVRRARAELLLRAGRHDEAQALLEALLQSDQRLESVVRKTLEAVPDAVRNAPALRLLLGQALAKTNSSRLALQELQAAQDAGVDPEAALAATEAMLAADPRSVDALVARARCAIGLGRADIASSSIKQALEIDPGRAESLRKEVESACKDAGGGPMRRLLVELYLHLEMPQEAAEALQGLHEAHDAASDVLYQLSADIAAHFGFSAPLLLVFVESALDTEHGNEARDALAHYLGSPDARTSEFTQRLDALLLQRPELASRLAPVVDGLPLPVELRLRLAVAGLESAESSGSLFDLEGLVLERPELRETALRALETHLEKHSGAVEALILAGDLSESAGRSLQASQYLARALRAAPSETDRICKLAEKVLRRDPKNEECWKEIVFALMDAQRSRHARELCRLAQQALPPEKHGFLYVANAEMLLASKQTQPAVNELENALACQDAAVERIVALLDRVIESDEKLPYARYVLAAALLRQGSDLDRAVVHLSSAVQQDDLLVDLAFELMADYSETLRRHAPARVLEGLLHLRRGDRARGVSLLDQALELQPQLAAQVLPALEAEWDRDAQNADLGIAFARALRGAGHVLRACRLAVDLARRFPDRQERLLGELQSMLDIEPLPEVHRALWEILVELGRGETAQEHLQQALEGTHDAGARRDLLESALRLVPDSPWVACRLAELEAREGHPDRAAEVVAGLLDQDSTQCGSVVASLRALPGLESSPELRLVEIDCLLAGRQGSEALAALRRFRDAFGTSRDKLVERYQALAAQGTAGPGAEADLGTLLREAGRLDEAVSVMERGLERLGSNAAPADSDDTAERELRLSLAHLYIERGREAEGRQLLATVLDRPGDHAETYGVLERLARQGLLSRVKSLRDAVTTHPHNVRAHLELARLSIVSMDFEGAREALSFTGDTPAIEAARRYLLARSHADEDHPDLALAVLRSIELDDVAEDELRRNVAYLRGVCSEHLGLYGEAQAHFLQILSEFPYFKDVRERVRRTYQKHLESALGPRAEVLEKRTHLDLS